MIVGPGEGPCTVLAVEADPQAAYARFPQPQPMRYRDGLLPGFEPWRPGPR